MIVDRRGHAPGIGKWDSCGYPATCIGAESAAGDYAVQMGMEVESASPGVQDGGDAEQGAEAAGVGRQARESLGGGAEQHREDPAAVREGQSAQLGRQGEDDVEVVGRHEAVDALLDPASLATHWHVGQWRLRHEL